MKTYLSFLNELSFEDNTKDAVKGNGPGIR